MYRTHTCGELRIEDIGKIVTLSGWVQKSRDLGGMTFVDVRDRYGITQLVFDMDRNRELCEKARKLGREFVIRVGGKVIERSNKNKQLSTGEIEIEVDKLDILNVSKTPPFTIEDKSDGGDDLRMKYRYLDLRRNPLKNNLILRHTLAMETRNYLSKQGFLEVETPCLIKSTPEGARDFVVPSRVNPGQFFALPQSPQTFKQLLMVSGYDKYFQLVKCFRDEDLRADRQPEFTQIDCEMSFVEQEDILNTFENLMKDLFRAIKGIEMSDFPRMTYQKAMEKYGSDKPDIRFGMTFNYFTNLAKNKGFKIFDEAESVIGIVVKNKADYSRKQLDKLTDFVRREQIGAKGMVYIKYNQDGSFKSSVDKFYSQEDLSAWAHQAGAEKGDLILVMSGDTEKTQKQLNELRLHLGKELNLRDPKVYKPLWVIDFPLLEWSEENQRFQAMHHPFTSPKTEDMAEMEKNPGSVRANAYDMVINGVEIGGGSIRIHDRKLQERMFDLLGFTREEAESQFGFLLKAFEYGAPPHGGIALGFDRLASMFGGQDSIRDFIAFPKNNAARDVMIDAPATIANDQLDELQIQLNLKK